jgi:hypothetical protein
MSNSGDEGLSPSRIVAQVYEEILHDSRGHPKGIIGELYQDGEVQFKINTIDTGIRGTELFLRMMSVFGDRVRSIRGVWPSGSNKDVVNELVTRGVPLEQAVTETWTARRAASVGFKTVKIILAVPGDPDGPAFKSVEVLFEP